MKKTITSFIPVFIFITASAVQSQQVPDTGFLFHIHRPAYQKECGPIVYIDEAHYNFHTRNGGFLPFAKLLEQDGFIVKGLAESSASPGALKDCKILVIANALDSLNEENWFLPTPSAFTPAEIKTVKQWVHQGGSLLLIADHMPFAGAAYDLGKAFGFDYLNGFAYTRQRSWPPSIFTISDSTLADSPVTNGSRDYENIDTVATFTGSAFRIPPDAIPVLVFRPEHFSLQPDTAWQFTADTPKQDLKGYFQGALLQYGKGRLAVFGEAAMFTAQIANGTLKAGFNSEVAPQNAQFLLNVIHWLDKDKK